MMVKCLIVLCILFVELQLGYSEKLHPHEKYKVVIVGAGIAGIGAASHLLRNNVSDILILEGSNRVGGRIYTYPFGDFLVELGCQWVHGQEGNVVYEIANPRGVLYIQNSDLVPTLMKHPQSKINMCLARPLFKKALDLFENEEEMTACKCSMEEYFNRKFEEMVKENNVDKHTAQAVKDLIMKVQGIEDGTGNLNKEGASGNADYWVPPGSVSVAWKSGYSTLIDMVTGKFDGQELPVMKKTKLNKVVDHIDWSGNGVVDISCEDGSVYSADHVIVTVSLGVLKDTAEQMFSPSLPPRKLSAIKNLGFDIVNKIFIQFDTRWWPLDYEFERNFLWSNEDKKKFKKKSKYGGWTTDITSCHYVENQPRVLQCWVVGETASALEHMADQEILDGCIELFHWFFGDKYSISEPIDIVRSKWKSDRFVQGAYSFATTESDRKGLTPKDLAEPLLDKHKNPVVLFAGEASHDHYFSTTHGALETGWREAKRILNLMG